MTSCCRDIGLVHITHNGLGVGDDPVWHITVL